MGFPKRLKELCTPAFIYFAISILGLAMVVLQNRNSDIHTLWIGQQHLRVTNVLILFLLKLLYILFWTWILNLMCRDGHSEISWLLVLVPFILFFLGMVMSV
jgi:hypothetical protein